MQIAYTALADLKMGRLSWIIILLSLMEPQGSLRGGRETDQNGWMRTGSHWLLLDFAGFEDGVKAPPAMECGSPEVDLPRASGKKCSLILAWRDLCQAFWPTKTTSK